MPKSLKLAPPQRVVDLRNQWSDEIVDHIAHLVASSPPLSAAQREKIRRLLPPSRAAEVEAVRDAAT